MRLSLLIRDLSYAGAQRQMVALAKGVRDRGMEVSVFCFYGGPLQADLEAAGIRIVCFGKKHRWDLLGFLWRVANSLRAERPDVLYSFLNEANVLAALLKPLLPGTKLVWGLRDSQTDAALYGFFGKAAFRLGRLLSSVPDLIIANSRSGAMYYEGQGYPRERIEVVPNGIDVEQFAPDPAARERIRAELGVKANEVLYGVVGRLSPMKDHATFLRAAAKMKDPSARFLCVGAGSEAYAREMRQLADELSVPVIWSEPRADMPALFNALDVLVSSSAFGEGFSNVTGEAMACGTRCVVTDVGDSAALVGDTGWAVPPVNESALAEAMELAANGPRSAMPRERILKQFTVPAMIGATLQAMEQAVSPAERAAKTKLLFITTALGSGGAEMMLTQIITHLDAHRFEPHVISLVEGGKHVETLRAAGIPVHSLGMKAGLPSLCSLWRLRSLTRKVRPDLIVGWMYHGNLTATLASWLGKRAPVLWNVRQSLYSLALEKRGSAMVIKALAWLGGSPCEILYNSKVSAQQHEAIGYPRSKTRIVPNGFDVTKFVPDAEARRSVRAELGLAEDAVLIGRFGRQTAMKDYPTFLKAMAQTSGAFAIIAGTGTAALKAQADCPGSVVVLDERQDLPRLTAAVDIACSSSAFGEGFPNVVAEAMCCGVPCVVTDVGDSAWLLGEGGKVVPARDVQALADALNQMIGMLPEERAALGAKGRQRILEDFNLLAVVAQFEAMLSKSTAHPSALLPNPCVA